jgi:hypothetical protein
MFSLKIAATLANKVMDDRKSGVYETLEIEGIRRLVGHKLA